MSTKRQPRGPRKALNERDLELQQQATGTSTPAWLRVTKKTHPLTQIHDKAKGKVEAREELVQARSGRVAKRSTDKENTKGTKRKGGKKSAAPASSEPADDASPPTKRICIQRPADSAPADTATASGRSSQHADDTPACMTEEAFASWLAAQPGQTVPVDQHRRLLSEFRALRCKYDELKERRWPEVEQMLNGGALDQAMRDARAVADHWRQECDQQAALAREAGTADLQQERDAAWEKQQQLATTLAEAEAACAAALLRAAAAEQALSAYRARVMATTGVQTDVVAVADHSAQAPAGRTMRVQLMPEGLEGSLGSDMTAKGVMVPATSSAAEQHTPMRDAAHGATKATPASAPQRLSGSPLGTHPAFPSSRHRASRLRRTTLADPSQTSEQRHLFASDAMSLATQGSGGTAIDTPARTTPFGLMTGLERVKDDAEGLRCRHPRTDFVYELKKIKDGAGNVVNYAYRCVRPGSLQARAGQLPCWMFQEIRFDVGQRETFLSALFGALGQA